MSKELFYKSDELSSPFIKPKTNKIIKKKKQDNIWNLSNLINKQFQIEFNQDNTNIHKNDYKWINIPSNVIDISLQPWITNLPTAIDSSLQTYQTEINTLIKDNTQQKQKIYKLKTKLNNDIIKQIKRQLLKCEIPNNTNVRNDLDPEYIFAKRQYLQSMIDETSKDIDFLQTQLTKENKELNDANNFVSTLQRQNNQLLRQNLLNETLHPLMIKIIQNEVGLIKDGTPPLADDDDSDDNNIIKYTGPMRRNKAKFNLVPYITENNIKSNDEYEILTQSLPSLTQLNQFIPSMTEQLETIISNDHTNKLFK